MARSDGKPVTVRRRLARLVRQGRGGNGDRAGGGQRRRRGAEDRVALPETPGFDLAVVAVLKNEASYIEEWLCHHMAAGVQHFFLYDNGSEDGIAEILRGYINHGLVTLVAFPMRGLQRDAYNHALRFYGSACEWLAYIDIDEFLVPVGDEDVPTILRRFPDAEQVLVARREFCFSGHRTRPDGLVTESYTLRSDDVPRVGRAEILAKSIIRPRGVWRMGVHSADTVNGRTVNAAGEPSPEGRPAIANPTYENIQMNHYYTKSWAEFSAKLSRANTSTHSFQLPEVPFDIPGEPDGVIDRWVPRTKALLAEMRTLSPRPYRYGSRLALPAFPRSDQFSVQAAGVVSNEIAGLERPRKQRSFDSMPMPGVRGALARAEDHGYEAAPGRLLGSIHATHQVKWLGGEVAWALPDGEPPLTVEGGTLRRDRPDGPWGVDAGSPEGAEMRLFIGTGGHPLRSHALLLALAFAGPASVSFSVQGHEGAWERATGFDVSQAGTYLGFIALDNKARTIHGVRVQVGGVAGLELFDLALVTYG